MELLTSLGVNQTLAVQFAVFLVTFAALKYLLFVPYFNAYHERNERTVGQTELAERFVAQTKELEEKYSSRAREVNEHYKTLFDKTRQEANKEYDRLVNEARGRSKLIVDNSREKIEGEISVAKSKLGQEVASVAQLINHQLIGKDFNA